MKVTNKIDRELMLMMLMSILKAAKNLLREILPQPGFKPGISLSESALLFSHDP